MVEYLTVYVDHLATGEDVYRLERRPARTRVNSWSIQDPRVAALLAAHGYRPVHRWDEQITLQTLYVRPLPRWLLALVWRQLLDLGPGIAYWAYHRGLFHFANKGVGEVARWRDVRPGPRRKGVPSA